MLSTMASHGTSKHFKPIPSQDPQYPEKVSHSKLHKDVIKIVPGSHQTSEEVETVTSYIGHMVCIPPPPQAAAIIQLSTYLGQFSNTALVGSAMYELRYARYDLSCIHVVSSQHVSVTHLYVLSGTGPSVLQESPFHLSPHANDTLS